MLKDNQIKYLCELSDFGYRFVGDKLTGISCNTFKDVSVNYNEFKTKMDLPDLRYTWLLNNHNIIAGGSVVDWIVGLKPNDYDFFFTDIESAEAFRLVAESFGFVMVRVSSYAATLINPEDNSMIQIVGYGMYNSPFFGKSREILDSFDISVCRFAIDIDNIFFNTSSLRDLITKTLRINKHSPLTADRIVKYCKKGFYVPDRILDCKKSESKWLPSRLLPPSW